MRKKAICLSMIVGLFFSVGVEISKKATEVNKYFYQCINHDFMINTNGPIDPEPKVIIHVVI